MTATLLDGKAIAARERAQIKSKVEAFTRAHGRPPGLDVILVGEDPASVVYTHNKERASGEVGMRGRLHRLAGDTTEGELCAVVQSLNADPTVDGILVQLPLPKGIDEGRVLELIDPAKDVDGFLPINAGRLMTGRPALVACTPKGCMRLIAESGVPLTGAHAVVVGRSNIVGKPVAMLLLAANATVTIAHSKTKNLAELCRSADVLVAAVGRPKMIPGDWIKPGAVVIDVGINRTAEGKLCGDVDTESAMERAGWITPVPGGVGPMTIAMLLDNTLEAAKARVAH